MTDSNLSFTTRPNAVAGGETDAIFGNFRMLVDGGIPRMARNINVRLDL